MGYLTKLAFSAALLTSFSTASFADKGWAFFPGLEDGFIFDPTLSVMAGRMQSTSLVGAAANGTGLELSINCPMLQPPTNRVRQQISFYQYKDGDSILQTFELNPHYVIEAMPKLEIGGGPGVGYVRADVDGRTANMVAFQLGGSIHYRINKIFIGAEARYQFTNKADVGIGTANGAKNARALLKIGYDL